MSTSPSFVEKLQSRALGIARRLVYLAPTATNPLGPRWLVLAVNNVCNLKCKMCDVGTGSEDTIFYKNLIGDTHGASMSPAVFDRILADASAFPLRPKISFSYTEPGIFPDLLSSIEKTKRAGFSATVVTNGYTLPRLADALVDIPLDELFVSVDGTRELHNRVRGSARSYDRIMAGLAAITARKRALGAERPLVKVIFVFTEETYLSLSSLIRELATFQPIGVVATLLNFVHPDSAAIHNARFGNRYPATVANLSQVNLGGFDIPALVHQMNEAVQLAASLNVELTLHPASVRDEDSIRRYLSDATTPAGGDHCTDPWHMMLLQTNGDVIPAHGRCFNTVVGNLDNGSLKSIWDGPMMRAFRRTLKAEGGLLPACSRCCGAFDRHATGLERSGFALQRFWDRAAGA